MLLREFDRFVENEVEKKLALNTKYQKAKNLYIKMYKLYHPIPGFDYDEIEHVLYKAMAVNVELKQTLNKLRSEADRKEVKLAIKETDEIISDCQKLLKHKKFYNIIAEKVDKFDIHSHLKLIMEIEFETIKEVVKENRNNQYVLAEIVNAIKVDKPDVMYLNKQPLFKSKYWLDDCGNGLRHFGKVEKNYGYIALNYIHAQTHKTLDKNSKRYREEKLQEEIKKYNGQIDDIFSQMDKNEEYDCLNDDITK